MRGASRVPLPEPDAFAAGIVGARARRGRPGARHGTSDGQVRQACETGARRSSDGGRTSSIYATTTRPDALPHRWSRLRPGVQATFWSPHGSWHPAADPGVAGKSTPRFGVSLILATSGPNPVMVDWLPAVNCSETCDVREERDVFAAQRRARIQRVLAAQAKSLRQGVEKTPQQPSLQTRTG